MNRNDHLTRLAMRAGRMARLVRIDAPECVIQNEALLILAAALALDTTLGKRNLASWLARNPAFAPDGGALVDLRNDTIDECCHSVEAFLDDEGDADRQLSTVAHELCEYLAQSKTAPACEELGGLGPNPVLAFGHDGADPLVSYAVIVSDPRGREDAETEAFLAVAKTRGFEIHVDEKRGNVRVRSTEHRANELNALRAAHFEGDVPVKPFGEDSV